MEPSIPHTQSAQRGGVLLVTCAVFAFSTASVLVLKAAPLSPYEITTGRLGIAALLVAVLARLNRQPLLPARADQPRFVLFGLITAIHFGAFVAALNYTTIAHALAIVYSAPVFVALFSAWLLHEPLTWRRWLGIGIVTFGIAVLVGFEIRWSATMLLGDALALLSAITYGLYSVAGRSQRTRYGLFTYTTAIYGLAALWTLPLAWLHFTPDAYHWRPVLAMVIAGLLPLGMGHTLYNAAVRRTHATIANLIATQEVTGGVILGAVLLGQMPHSNEVIGALISLAGVALVLI